MTPSIWWWMNNSALHRHLPKQASNLRAWVKHGVSPLLCSVCDIVRSSEARVKLSLMPSSDSQGICLISCSQTVFVEEASSGLLSNKIWFIRNKFLWDGTLLCSLKICVFGLIELQHKIFFLCLLKDWEGKEAVLADSKDKALISNQGTTFLLTQILL